MAEVGKATIVDVARLAGVSVTTVSRVINGKPDVSERTRDRVLEIMRESGFTANPAARSLVGGSTRLVGVVARTANSAFTAGIIQGAMEIAEEEGYGLLLIPTAVDASGHSAQMLRTLADGLIIVTPGLDYDLGLTSVAKRLVFIEQRSGLGNLGVTVTTSNRGGARDLTSHLLALGHRRIAVCQGPQYLDSSQERFEGYCEALLAAGIAVDDDLVFAGGFDFASGQRAGERFATSARPPTAIMASNDRSAFGVLQALRERGIRVPEDMSVVGFDDVPFAAEEMPALTTVHQPINEMGRAAMQVLVDWIEDGQPARNHIELPTKLVIRASAGPPRHIDPA